MKEWPKPSAFNLPMDYERARAEAAMERLNLLLPLIEHAGDLLRDYICTLEKNPMTRLYAGRKCAQDIMEALALIGEVPQ